MSVPSGIDGILSTGDHRLFEVAAGREIIADAKLFQLHLDPRNAPDPQHVTAKQLAAGLLRTLEERLTGSIRKLCAAVRCSSAID